MSDGNWITLYAIDLIFEDSWLIGGLSTLSDKIDIPFVQNPRTKEPVLPGPSIAGSLRATAMKVLSNDATEAAEYTEELFGYVTSGVESDGKKEKTMTAASAVEILGAKLADTKELPETLERRRTAINGKTGAALNRMLRNEEIVGRASYRIIVQVQGRASDDHKSYVSQFDEVLKNWHPQLGRGRSVGLGCGKIKNVERVSVNLDSDKGLQWWLFEKQFLFGGHAKNIANNSDSNIEYAKLELQENTAANLISVQFELKEPVHIGFEKPESGPILIYRQFGHPTIPATSWKGVFRHRVETIVTLVEGPDLANDVANFMFGSSDTGRGLLRFRNSGFTDVNGKAISKKDLRLREHVAIDRFSGGAKDTAKFTWECVPPGFLTKLDIDFPDKEKYTECNNLIKHVIRDLHEGIIGIGAGISRGYGRLSAEDKKNQYILPMKVDVEKLKMEVKQISEKGEVK